MWKTYSKFSFKWQTPLLKLNPSGICLAILLLISISAQAQNTISGQVKDEQGAPMPGVNVLVKSTTTGTSTDIDGKYSLSVQNGAVLVFSFIGYVSTEVQVGTQTTIDLTMQPDVSTLSELVVVGYGTQNRGSVTGAISSVNAKEVTALPVTNVQQALQGRVAGVQVTNNGSPGANPIVRIRGIGSITGSSEPLYVIDGVPSGGLNNIDPKDIESVDVLKDAASSAIYGSRAANGVILVTTKKGSAGKLSVNIDSYYGVQKAWNELDLLKRDQYLQYGTDLINNAGGALPYRFSHMDEPLYTGTTQTYAQTETDWQNEVFRSAPIYQTTASAVYGTDKVKLYTSAGMFGQDGIMIGTGFNRYNFRFNSEIKLSKFVTFGQTLTLSSSKQKNLQESGGRTIIHHTLRSVPYLPVYDPTRNGGYRGADNNDGSDPENPVRIQMMDQNKRSETKILGTAYLNFQILPSLSYRFTIGGDYYSILGKVDQPIYNDGRNGRQTHNLEDNRNTGFNPLFQNQLTFDKQFGQHTINVVAVAERQDFKNTDLNISAQQSRNDITALAGGSNIGINANGTYESTLLSYLGRVTYDYADKYLLSASFRRDGYSNFAPGHYWGNFPGVSVGWRMSEESFMNDIEIISDFKLRGSYGELGSYFGVNPFAYQSLIKTNTAYPFNNSATGGAYFDNLENRELTWETTRMINYGFDLGILEDRFTLTAEYYQRKVDDLLLDVDPARSLGFSTAWKGNVGKMENSGLEITLGYHKHQGELTFDVSGNVTTLRNKVTDLYLPGLTFPAGANPDFGDITQTFVGTSVQPFYGYVVDGIFQSEAEIIGSDGMPVAAVQNLPLNDDGSVNVAKYHDAAFKGSFTRPGDIKFKDLNNDGVINDKDRQKIGSFLPDFTYGLNVNARYKNFDFTLFVQGVKGNEVFNGTKLLTQGMGRLFGAETEVLNAWTPTNTDTDIPRAVNGDPNQNARISDRFVEDGSYMRIKNLSIGYSLPSSLLTSFANGSVKTIRVYATFQNLVTITKYSGLDPEVGSRNNGTLTQGIDFGQYPQPRTMMAGIQVGF